MHDAIERAEILLEALPYIKKYNGATMVIKYGGAAMQSDELKNSVMKDVVLLNLVGIKVVLVHGGGPELTSMLDKLGKETKFVDGLRYTDAETAEIAAMVLAGKVNKELVSHIHKLGGKAVGICGIDGGMMLTEKREGADLGYVGQIKSIDTAPILSLLESGYIPIIATVGVDDDGQVYNINADTAAGEIAVALQAEKLISLSDVRGILKDMNDESSLIDVIKIDEVQWFVDEGIIAGGMLPKIDSCADAIERGVKETAIIDGRIPHSIILELFSDSGIGTLIKK